MKTQSHSVSSRRASRRPMGKRKQPFIDRYRGAITGAAGVILIGGALVIAMLEAAGSSGSPAASPRSQALDPAVAGQLTSVDAGVFDAVGAGTASNAPKAIDGAPIEEDGKPEILYVGAEFCPFCAAERWPLLLALSRFGTFSDLRESHSAADDVHPNTPTVSFYGSSYESDYLSFTAVETATNQRAGRGYEPLESLNSEQQRIVDRYNQGGGIPFIYMAGEYALSGASFSPSLLAGMDVSEVAAAIENSDSAQAQAIAGSANVLTAALCDLTGGQPGEVCQSPGVVEASSRLK